LSDIDYGGVFVSPINDILDLGLNYVDQVSNETNDETYYELKKFMLLLCKSNPTVLESLFIDDKFVVFEHDVIKEIKSHRDKFLTKKCFASFFKYGESQIKKAKGLNKMINWEIPQRKNVMDFTYTFYNQGSTKINNWLEYRNLKQNYCGLVNIPNMEGVYGVYYDWGNFFLHENISFEDLKNGYLFKSGDKLSEYINKIKNGNENKELYESCARLARLNNMVSLIIDQYGLSEELFYDYEYHDETLEKLKEWYENQKPIGYSGMVGERSESLRLSSVSKGEKPICYASFNKNGYVKHCVDYKNYKDWEAHRNPIRYESNLKKSYDAKNMSECFRLMKCGIEVANGEGFNVDRTNIDREFLLDVKNHKFEYDELIEKLNALKEEMNRAMEASKLQDDVDIDFVNSLYLKIRKELP
jgi:hypothetical protein